MFACVWLLHAGHEVWTNSLTVIVINPKRQRGGGAKPAAAQVGWGWQAPQFRLCCARIFCFSLGLLAGNQQLHWTFVSAGCCVMWCWPLATQSPLGSTTHAVCLYMPACMRAQESAASKPLLLSELSVPGNAGRAYGALTADRNPIHLSSLTSQVRRLGKTSDAAVQTLDEAQQAAINVSQQSLWW